MDSGPEGGAVVTEGSAPIAEQRQNGCQVSPYGLTSVGLLGTLEDSDCLATD